MSFFKNPDFFSIQQLDLNNKLIVPTVQLYAQISTQLKILYQNASNTLIDAHRFLAQSSQQVYDHPKETLTVWYGNATQTKNELLATFKSDILPQAKGHYQQLVVDATNAGREIQATTQAFFSHPKQSTDAVLAHASDYFLAFTGQAKTTVISSYDALAELFGLLVSQPIATVQALYKNALSTVLDLYFDMISSLLVNLY